MQAYLFILALVGFIGITYAILSRGSPIRPGHVFKIFMLGFVGWFIAYIARVPLISEIQILILTQMGVDYTDSQALAQYQTYFPLIIWGPLFAGLFEGSVRYFLASKSIDIKNNRKRIPAIYGLGWSSVEIFILIILPILVTDITAPIPTFNFIVSLVERIMATVFHITLSYVALYGNFEPKGKKISFILVMLLHSLGDSIILVWLIAFGDLALMDVQTYYITLELVFMIYAVIVAFWTWKVWIPRGERLIVARKDELAKAEILGDAPPPPPTTKTDIEMKNIL
jgi:uncharacterized membrane protein YhfC